MASVDDTKQRILDAAGRIFAERGFQTATVREICSAAGCNLAAVNYHFGDKERLYIEAVKQAHHRRLQDVPAPVFPNGTPAEEQLRAFTEALLVRMLADDEAPWHSQLMLRELFQPTAACEQWVREYIRPQFQMLLGILGQLLPESVPMARRRLLAFSVVGQCMHYKVAAPVIRLLVDEAEYRTLQPAPLARHICDVTLAAVRQWSAENPVRDRSQEPQS